MKVCYDSQIFGLQDYGGISRYFVEIINRMSSNKIDTKVNLFISHNAYVKKLGLGIFDKIFAKSNYRNYLYTLVNMIFGIPELLFENYDILHPTYYEPYFLPFIRKPYVITVYDMVHELFSKEYKNLSAKTIRNKKLLITKAKHIIAISENTKKDIIKIYNINPNKISVIYLGNSLKTWDGVHRLNLPSKYILFVGQRWIYKNFFNFIISIGKVTKDNDIKVVCAGGNNFTDEEISLIDSLGLKDKVIYFPINSDEELSEFYSKAEFFVYPSRYEGFGIPILEAFVNKCPVVISNSSCFPEIAQKAALYFNPDNVESIENKIREMLGSNKLRKKLIKDGTDRLRFFSWDKTATETAKVYKKLME